MKTLIFIVAILAIGASYALILDKERGTRIVNGNKASLYDMPYQVGLLIYSFGSTTSGSKCGGALISSRVVLTAAHCFTNRQKKGEAYLGTNQYRKGTIVKFSRVTVHERYDTKTYQNDIALVHLDKAVRQNGSTIKFIRLDGTYLRTNTKLTVSGYGLTAVGVNTNSLYYTQMFVRNKQDCDIFTVPIIDSMICAKGVNGKETCAGDSGGPVVRNWPHNPTHVGLVSFGTGCQKGQPKVFTRTSSYINWIQRNMR